MQLKHGKLAKVWTKCFSHHQGESKDSVKTFYSHALLRMCHWMSMEVKDLSDLILIMQISTIREYQKGCVKPMTSISCNGLARISTCVLNYNLHLFSFWLVKHKYISRFGRAWEDDPHAEKQFCSYFVLIIVPVIPAGIAFINDSYSETGGLFGIQSYDSDRTIVEGIFQWIFSWFLWFISWDFVWKPILQCTVHVMTKNMNLDWRVWGLCYM